MYARDWSLHPLVVVLGAGRIVRAWKFHTACAQGRRAPSRRPRRALRANAGSVERGVQHAGDKVDQGNYVKKSSVVNNDLDNLHSKHARRARKQRSVLFRLRYGGWAWCMGGK